MADNIGNKAAHDYHLDIAPVQEGFYVEGGRPLRLGHEKPSVPPL